MSVYREALKQKIAVLGGHPEVVLEYMMTEYNSLRPHGPLTTQYMETLKEVRHEYIKSLNGSFDRGKIKTLIRKYSI
jgi:hypothetical protein